MKDISNVVMLLADTAMEATRNDAHVSVASLLDAAAALAAAREMDDFLVQLRFDQSLRDAIEHKRQYDEGK